MCVPTLHSPDAPGTRVSDQCVCCVQLSDRYNAALEGRDKRKLARRVRHAPLGALHQVGLAVVIA